MLKGSISGTPPPTKVECWSYQHGYVKIGAKCYSSSMRSLDKHTRLIHNTIQYIVITKDSISVYMVCMRERD